MVARDVLMVMGGCAGPVNELLLVAALIKQ